MTRIEVGYIYIYVFEDNIMRPTKHGLKEGEEEEDNGNMMEGMNLFKVHGIITLNFPHIITV
jgi:hypothetical protein